MKQFSKIKILILVYIRQLVSTTIRLT